MTIMLNVSEREVTAPTVAELLDELAMPQRGVAVAINLQVVRREELAETPLQEGDRVDIVRAVQGG